MDKKQLKQKAKAIDPIVRIGKAGLNESVLKEIIQQLKSHKLIKIKLLKSCLDSQNRKEMAKEIVKQSEAELVLFQGGVIALYKK
ncbi:YhbY family RNA-binding protein [Candidatus Woesearchaeota archaeon]|jgi:RNA-binding protein|nr:YhbY family RNA-binding protein [Candidatus Woesearchaeota archaeon]MBT5272055.1 YhbY family RNA-binding protein [Candidatus Woesearchaeota archaeon]MBT6041805.1 YhbY family RNA-binding protein [Candidatus Woesearchaeota archaeon]MBT6336820.1 YhbY family RNA-binding protein [Candidatus Woesearchaeota archaeon]MBT7927645.1 YhbY family RNA-binding protein [Candidatus Woesearchaeota archaeon]